MINKEKAAEVRELILNPKSDTPNTVLDRNSGKSLNRGCTSQS